MVKNESDSVPSPAEFEFSGELVRRRKAAHLSQRELAVKVAFTREYLSRAEKPGGSVSPEAVKAVDAALGAGGDLVGLHAAALKDRKARRGRMAENAVTGASRAEGPDDWAVGLSASKKTAVDQGSSNLTEGSFQSRHSIALDPLIIDDIEDRVGFLANRYFRMSRLEFRGEVQLLSRRANDLLCLSMSPSLRRRVYANLAALTAMLAEVTFAIGENADVDCSTAIALATEAGHSQLVGWVRGTQAQIALHTGNPVGAARYARGGLLVSPAGSTAAVRSATYLARAGARLGDSAGARDAWRSAEQAWATVEGALSPSIFSLSADYLECCQLTMQAWLGRPNSARRLIDIQDSRTPTVGRAIREIDIALIRIGGGEVEEAIAAGHRALSVGGPRWTPPLRDRFSDLIGVLRSYKLPAVDELERSWQWISN